MRPADGGGGGGVTLDTIRHAKPENLHTAASSLTGAANKLTTSHGDFTGSVVNPLGAGYGWNGAGQPQANGRTNSNAGKISGVAARLSPGATVLNGFAGYLTGAKAQLSKIDSKAKELHVTISPTGDVTVNDKPGESKDDKDKREKAAGQLLVQVQAVLRTTKEADGKAAAQLNGLQKGDPTSPPALEIFGLDYWKKNFSDPAFWGSKLAGTMAALAGTLKDGSVKFSASAAAQAQLAKSVTNPAMVKAAQQAAAKGFGTAFDMGYMYSKLGVVGKGLTKTLSSSVPVLSKIPYVSVALTGAGIAADKANGESTGQAVTSNVAATGASLLAAEGTMAALSATALAGGPATLIGVGVGVGVAFGVNYVVDHWDGISQGIEDGAKAVGDTIGDGAKAVGDFFGF